MKGLILIKRIEDSIDLIWRHAKKAEEHGGYTLAFSGGKDSQVLYDLMKKSGVPFVAEYSVTTIDPPENVRFIRQHYPDVKFIFPPLTFFQLIEKKGMLPTMTRRWCCVELKEKNIRDYLLTGVRREESTKRATYDYVQENGRKKGKIYVRPLLDWTEADIWEYIEQENLPVNPCYEHGRRVGCIFCPFASQKALIYAAKRYPKYYRLLMRSIARIIEDKGYLSEFGKVTPEKAFEWWISKRNAKEFFSQLNIFDAEIGLNLELESPGDKYNIKINKP